MNYAIEILENELESNNRYIRACQHEIAECKGGVNLSESYKENTISDNTHLMALVMNKTRDIEDALVVLRSSNRV
ncbi:hypothetical protein ACFVS2_20585 [Brevibacillus sp. NPDC058079]|uniref:hypothetical protein n=1 Tax=Brevibacillus sp. NPDC058079 TaxID=3346330 RepID=UPI0036ED93D0